MPKLSAPILHRTQPLLNELDALFTGTGVELLCQSQDDVRWSFENAGSEYALVSPLVYAAHQGDYSILGGACVAAVSSTDDLLLVINKGLASIASIAVSDDFSMETILTWIVLKEKFDISPLARPFKGDWLHALETYDAALVTRETTSTIDLSQYAVLDIIDEWFDFISLPFVREILIGWNDKIESEHDAIVRDAGNNADRLALENLMEWENEMSLHDAVHTIPGHYRYRFDEDVVEGLNTFYRFAFFHGYLRDIPELHFRQQEMTPAS